MWLRIFGIILVTCFMIPGCLKNTEHFDGSICSIIQPGDTVISCRPFKPIVKVLYGGFHSKAAVCTLRARIWRYKINMDSLGSVSMDSTKPISVYDTFNVTTITPGIHLETLPEWHPVWSDIYRVGQRHTIEITAHIAFYMMSVNDRFIDDFIVKARSHDLQVNYVGLLNSYGNVAIPDDTISVGISYKPVSIVSNSPLGPTAIFRSWCKIIRLPINMIVYSRYLDKTLQPGQDTCICYQSGWVPPDTGLYKITSWIEMRLGVDSIPDNNYMERCFYAKLASSEADIYKNSR